MVKCTNYACSKDRVGERQKSRVDNTENKTITQRERERERERERGGGGGG